MVDLAAAISVKDVSPVEVVNAHLEQIERLNGQLNAIVTLSSDSLEQAKKAESIMMSGQAVGALLGIPLTVKDTIATAGIRTTSGSLARKDYVPNVDATAVARLKAAGAIILAKSNTPELAIPYETSNEVFGRTNNPYDQRLTPGGSSGGEAAAIAACLSPGGVGSDLSGSIRVPAHFCGIVGLKPTSGLIPMDGHVPVPKGVLASGACLGPMARTVADVSLLFSVLAGIESAPLLRADQVSGLKAYWYDSDGVSPVSRETSVVLRATVEALERAGLVCTEKRPAAVESGSRLWVQLFAGASATDLREFYSGSEELAGPLARKILNTAKRKNQHTQQDPEQVIYERDRLRAELLTMMETTPLIIAPVGASAAFPHATTTLDIDGDSVSVFRAFSYAQTCNVFDLPSVVVRAGHSADGLPLGVQIIGKPFAEHLILSVAAIIEAALGGWQPPSNTEADPL
jgi:Asp-tRNA(Asn)/Glu-tRNA(Gln) amidotransferase A subunit family amidase